MASGSVHPDGPYPGTTSPGLKIAPYSSAVRRAQQSRLRLAPDRSPRGRVGGAGRRGQPHREVGQILAGLAVAVGLGEAGELVHDANDAAVGGRGETAVSHVPQFVADDRSWCSYGTPPPCSGSPQTDPDRGIRGRPICNLVRRAYHYWLDRRTSWNGCGRPARVPLRGAGRSSDTCRPPSVR